VGPLTILLLATAPMLLVVFVVMSILILTAIENDTPSGALTALLVTLGLVWFFTDFSIRYQVVPLLTWQHVLAFLVAYVAIGVAWSFVKWYFYLSARYDRWVDANAAYKRHYDIETNTVVSQTDSRFLDFIRHNYREFTKVNPRTGERVISPRPEPDRYKISSWMGFWPWSVFWSLVDDVLVGIFRFFYRQCVGIYRAMAAYMFPGFE
jgi:hypothetical protein